VLSEQAGLLAPESSLDSGLPDRCRSVAGWAACSSVTVAGPRRYCTELPF